jgi:hypothetical protein
LWSPTPLPKSIYPELAISTPAVVKKYSMGFAFRI